MLNRRALLLTAPLLAAASARAATKPRVVATFSILGDFVRQVGGDEVELATLVGPDADSHSFQPTPADARKLARADVLVSNGLGLEGWLDRLAQAAEFKGKTIVASRGSGVDDDPHCWQDVACARRYAATIAAGLGTSSERAAAYDRRLAVLDGWVRAEIARVPAGKRRVITSHQSFGYFARAYGVAFNSVRGPSDDSEPSARDIARLIREARSEKIKALFIENFGNPALVAEIARDSDAVVGPPLYTDALSKPDGPAPTYEAMMRYNVSALVAGMLKN
ncbi:MAG TPA: zinc ABC transporter substrate-binding protein [Reyranella sp.]|jgi:zinc/manganese transport system substrate-binding protein|nr:zinc ABC transporter substrate-binding protein [Reyranella sp.]